MVERYIAALCALFLLTWSPIALASFPATQSPPDFSSLSVHQSACQSTYGAACSLTVATAATGASIYCSGAWRTGPGWCGEMRKVGGNQGQYVYAAAWAVSGLYSCPFNSLLSGSSCSCNSGFSQVGSTCVDPNAQKCTETKDGSDLFTGFSTFPGVGTSFCPSDGAASSCASKVTGGFGVVKNGVKTWTIDVQYTGATCLPPSSSGGVSQTTCKGTVGTLNGITICSPPSDRNVIESVKSTTATNPVTGASAPGTAGSTTSQDSTVCTGAMCTTTTTTTTTTAGGVATTTTATKEQPQEDFCAQNPRSLACKEFALGDVAAESVGSSTVNLAINKAPSFGPETAACPAPKTVSVLGINLVMPFTLLCDFAAMIRPLLIGFAYLSAALTFFGFAKK